MPFNNKAVTSSFNSYTFLSANVCVGTSSWNNVSSTVETLVPRTFLSVDEYNFISEGAVKVAVMV